MGDITPYANSAVYVVEGLLVFFILYKIISARRGRELFIRRIPGLSSLDEAVGRATEMGKPMLFVPGIGGLTVVGLQAMAILQHVVQRAAKFLTRVIVPNIDPIMFTISEEISKEAYASEGVPEQFDPGGYPLSLQRPIRPGRGCCRHHAPRKNSHGALLWRVLCRGR